MAVATAIQLRAKDPKSWLKLNPPPKSSGNAIATALAAQASDGPRLSLKHERFCHEYVVDLDGQAAAIRAGYSPRSAKVTAARLLTDANLVAEIRRLQNKILERVDINAERVPEAWPPSGFSTSGISSTTIGISKS